LCENPLLARAKGDRARSGWQLLAEVSRRWEAR
jgi:hypothetical protein